MMSLRDEVHELATTVGATFDIRTTENGKAIIIALPGVGSVLVHADWDDDRDQIIGALKTKMTAAGMLAIKHEYLLDFGSGRTATIWAPSEKAAIRLAGQGEPEMITDLTTGESKAWVVA